MLQTRPNHRENLTMRLSRSIVLLPLLSLPKGVPALQNPDLLLLFLKTRLGEVTSDLRIVAECEFYHHNEGQIEPLLDDPLYKDKYNREYFDFCKLLLAEPVVKEVVGFMKKIVGNERIGEDMIELETVDHETVDMKMIEKEMAQEYMEGKVVGNNTFWIEMVG
jgi:hypothetical protein